jgi:predicted nucleic acid-binding protein
MSAVVNDHAVLGFNTIDYGNRGFISYPLLTNIVDEALFAKLRAVPLKEVDAKHVMLAVANDCQFFLTLDERDLLPVRSAIEAICPQLRIVRPTELITELEKSPKA